jgi:hypothetical protein
MTYARAPQPCDGAMLPLPATARCFATVIRPHSDLIRYLCGDGEDARCQVFAAPVRRQAAPTEHAHRTGKQEQALWLLRAAGCCGLPESCRRVTAHPTKTAMIKATRKVSDNQIRHLHPENGAPLQPNQRGSPTAASAPAGRACRITNQSLSFKEQRSCGAALMPPARDRAAPQSLSP